VRERPLLTVPRALEILAGAFGVAAFVIVLYAGYAGAQVATGNLAPTVIYVVFWVGIPFASALLGDVFRAINPWLAIGNASGWVVQRAVGGEATQPLPYPRWLGRWPALIGVVVFAWVELVYANRDDPSQLANASNELGAVHGSDSRRMWPLETATRSRPERPRSLGARPAARRVGTAGGTKTSGSCGARGEAAGSGRCGPRAGGRQVPRRTSAKDVLQLGLGLLARPAIRPRAERHVLALAVGGEAQGVDGAGAGLALDDRAVVLVLLELAGGAAGWSCMPPVRWRGCCDVPGPSERRRASEHPRLSSA
jgi:hypothetical protein